MRLIRSICAIPVLLAAALLPAATAQQAGVHLAAGKLGSPGPLIVIGFIDRKSVV